MKVAEELTEEKGYFIEEFREKLMGKGIDFLVGKTLGKKHIGPVKEFLEWVVSKENIDSIKEIFNYQQQLLSQDEAIYESVKDFLIRNKDELHLAYDDTTNWSLLG